MTFNRTDIHFHILAGIDDGPTTMDESVALARAAVRDGTDTVVATPHVRSDYVSDVRELRDRVRELKEALAREEVPLSVIQGGELGHDMVGRLGQAELDSIAQGPPRRRWLLVEAPFTGLTGDFTAATDELRDRGFGIVLAHPERSSGVLGANRASLDRELSAGSVLQVNGPSLAGDYGPVAEETALLLVHRGLVNLVASDAHGPRRPPALNRALRTLLDDGIDRVTARALVGSRPRQVLARGVERVPARLA
jgi:protein-tyrosine phosphatase